MHFNSFRQNCIKYCSFEIEKCTNTFNNPSGPSTGNVPTVMASRLRKAEKAFIG